MFGDKPNATIFFTFTFIFLFHRWLLSSQSTIANEKTNVEISDVDLNTISYNTKLVVITRIHAKSASSLPPPSSIYSFIINTLKYSQHVIICIDAGKFLGDMNYISSLQAILSQYSLTETVDIIPITPWGHFTSALNIGVIRAKELNFNFVCFQSFEVKISNNSVKRLLQIASENNTLLVGPAFSGHLFQVGIHELNGRTCPWNTFAIWSMDYLFRTGFAMISDGVGMSLHSGGVEEIATANLLMHLYPQLVVKLVHCDDVEWDTDFQDAERAKYHEKKMESKNSRSAAQMNVLGIGNAKVHHITL